MLGRPRQAGELPLATIVSQALVAYTIEFDNEFERLLPHRTTRADPADGRGPWLTSLVMWSNLMRFVDDAGVSVGELENAGGNLAGMERWGYVELRPDPSDLRPRPPRAERVVRPTAVGRSARATWAGVFGVIDGRWDARFGGAAVARLRASLQAIVDRLDGGLPEYLPVLGYGLRVRAPPGDRWLPASRADQEGADGQLSVLLSRVLLAFTLEFERDSAVSLAISANVMRLLDDDDGVAVRDLPHLAGISREAVSMAVGFLERSGLVGLTPDPSTARAQAVSLTPAGRAARAADRELFAEIDERWRERFGGDRIADLRTALEPLVGAGDLTSPLQAGLVPYLDGWRASVRRPVTLPHQPVVLHRGGFPDGS